MTLLLWSHCLSLALMHGWINMWEKNLRSQRPKHLQKILFTYFKRSKLSQGIPSYFYEIFLIHFQGSDLHWAVKIAMINLEKICNMLCPLFNRRRRRDSGWYKHKEFSAGFSNNKLLLIPPLILFLVITFYTKGEEYEWFFKKSHLWHFDKKFNVNGVFFYGFLK